MKQELLRCFISFYDFLLCCTASQAQVVLTPEQVYLGTNRSENHIDAIYEDQRGFIWAASVEGLIRYDGAVIKKFPYVHKGKEYAKGFAINHINEDPTGNIWCVSNEVGLLRLRSGPMGYDTLRSYHPEIPVTGKIRFDKKGNLWAIASFQLFYLDVRTGRKTIYPLTKNMRVFYFDMNKEGDLWFSTADRIYAVSGVGSKRETLKVVHKGYYVNLQLAGNDLYLVLKNEVTRILKDQKCNYEVERIYPQDLGKDTSYFFMPAVTVSVNSRFIVTHEAELPIVLIDKITKKVIVPEIRNMNLSKKEIYSYCITRSGLLYIGTDKGLLRANLGNETFVTFYFPEIDKGNMRFRSVFAQHKDTLLLGSRGRGIYRYVRRKGRFVHDLHIAVPGNRTSNTINQFYRDKKNRIWIGTNAGLYRYDEKNSQCMTVLGKGACFCITEDEKGMLWIGLNTVGILKYDPGAGQREEFHYKKAYPTMFEHRYERVWNITSHKGYIYVSTACGPLRLDPVSKKITPLFPQLQNLNVWNMSISDSVWYICTQEKGIWKYPLATGFLQPISTEEQQFFYAKNDGQGNTWVINDKGVSRYDGQRFSKYEITDGLHSNMLSYTGIEQLSDSEMVVCGEDGFTVINILKLPRSQASPQIVFTQLTYGGSEKGNLIALPTDIRLDYEKGPLTLRWAITNDEGKNYRVSFQLKGIDTAMHQANSHDETTYTDLPPGNYTMEMALTDETVQYQYKQFTFHLTIVPPFWMTLWFKVTMISLGLGGFFYLFYSWVSRQRLSHEKVRYNMEALRSQMNPHFVFNALNSIQSFIYREKKEVANEYLVKFSRLIRMILEYSREEFIPLPLELNFLQLYLEIEAHRFHNKMTFEIISEKTNTMCKVPPLLIQPLVENAIKHGIGPADHQLHICIRFTLNDQMLIVEVTDNGQGRQHKNMEESDKTSLGIKLIEERLALLTRTTKKKYNLNIQDRASLENIRGTYVRLTIPQ